MRIRTFTIAAAITLLVSAAPAYAQGFVSPYISASFAGDADDAHRTFGVSAGWLGGGVLGFEVDFGWAPEFFGESEDFGDNNLTTLMGNLMVGAPIGNFRPYASGGAGLLRQRVDGVEGFFGDVDNNDFGMNVGAGLMGFFSDNVGLRGDVRYFRSLQDPEPDNEFDIATGNFDFWRATVGLTFRF